MRSIPLPAVRASLLLVFGLCLAASLQADTATLRPAADTSLWAPDSNNNLGRSDLASGRTRNAGLTRALMRFDLGTNVPPGSQITSVRLTLRVVKVPPGQIPSTFGLHRMLKSWTEGTKSGMRGALATAGETTWNMQAAPATAWSAPGGAAGTEYVASSSLSRSMAGVGLYAFESTPSAVADVQRWLDQPSENFGWVLISGSEGTPLTAKRIGSRETAQFSPSLVIEFTPPPAAEPPAITLHPLSQTNDVNATVSFQVAASGSAPLSYQWFKGAAALQNATNATLTLTAITLNDAGSYTCQVTNSAGNATSNPATLTVNQPPQHEPDLSPTISDIEIVGPNVRLTFTAKAGNIYQVQTSPILEPNAPWTTINSINAPAQSTPITIEDPLGPGAKFYRLQAQLAP